MQPWNLTDSEIDVVDAEPWDMPLGGSMRPFGVRSIVRLYVASALLLTLSGCGGLVLAVTSPSAASHPDLFIVFNVGALAFAAAQTAIVLATPTRLVRRFFPTIALVSFAATPVLVTTGFASGGPPLGFVVVSYIQGALLAFYILHTRWAIAYCVVMLVCVAAVLRNGEGWTAPFGAWTFIAANVIGTAVLVGQIAASLEERVNAQVTEIERLGRLRRFLSPQVADAVLSGRSHEATQPHRRRIAVLFCDLRGFTAFTNTAEPEEVIGVLDEYYRAVGGLLHEHGATIGEYAGDGIMGYLGDPVPRDDSALAAVTMTREIVALMSQVTAEWQRRGYDLDYGIGIAYGYATLGIVGFDGRYDYTPIGGVVNLASRLCAKAGPSKVLIDHATYAETSDVFPSDRVADIELKGYGAPQRAYTLAQLPG